MAKQTRGISIDALYARLVGRSARRLAYAARPTGRTPAAWQRRLRRKLLELLGIAGRPKPPPPVRFVEEVPCEGYVRRRGYMVASDELAVPLYLLRPDPVPEGALGVCLAIHGHGPGKIIPAGIARNAEDRRLIAEGERDYAVQAVRRGYLTLVPDLRGFGELVLAEDLRNDRGGWGGGCLQLAMRSIQLGTTLMGQRVADLMQLLDWALAERNVDRRRVVITGNSGGGMMSVFAAAVDRRIAAAAPSCYFSTFAGSILAVYHCPCNFVPGLAEVAEMSDLGGLIAPRPMLVVAGTQDPIFPIDAVREGFAELERIYADLGAAERLELFEGAGGHRYYARRVWDFFAEQFG
jgi:dienelactone hydrolase